MQKQIEQLYNPLFLYVKKRINNHLDAEDLTQEVFYKLSKSKNNKVENIKSWLYTIAKNTITDYYRKKKYISEDFDNIALKNETELDNDSSVELSNCVIPFVNQLPDEYKAIMTLSELEGISQKEIAEKLDLNYITVRSKVQRGRKKLKDLFTDCCNIIQGGKGSILNFEKNKGCDTNC